MRNLFKSFLLLGLIVIAAPSFAQIQIGINFGPPPLRHEVRIARPAIGFTWVGGYYTYDDGRRNYDWVPGRWEAPPSTHHIWVAPRYRRNGDHYEYYTGSWKDRGEHDNGKHKSGKQGNGRQNGKSHGKGKH